MQYNIDGTGNKIKTDENEQNEKEHKYKKKTKIYYSNDNHRLFVVDVVVMNKTNEIMCE